MAAPPVFLPIVPGAEISYDICTRKLEDLPPNGWNVRPSTIYRKIARVLCGRGFVRTRYSDWIHPTGCMGVYAWMTMLSLFSIQPLGILESTLKGLKMHYHFIPAIDDITVMVQLGGFMSNTLRGLTPANLVIPVLHP